MKTLRTKLKNAFLGLMLATASLPAFLSWEVHAEIDSSVTMADFQSYPVINTESATPLVMMVLSLDHQLFFKAYNDYSDVNGDGIVDTTYNHDHDYYGYFDGDMCYQYDTSDDRFEPRAITDTSGYCTGDSGNYWVGNFLNWITMTRIDSARKLLYGGKRSTDTATTTVLERAFLPHDAHSFAKYYGATDAERLELQKLTSFDSSDMNDNGGGMTFCNTTRNDTDAYSQNVTEPPLLRVAEGNWSLWASNERWQCTWEHEEKDASNANDPSKSGLDARSNDPSESSDGRGATNYVVRVQVCESGLIDQQSCRLYPNGNYKPAGLLQKYGENDQMRFGLITGSYGKNKSGGVLRKGISNFANEVNKDTDGTFIAIDGLVRSLNAARLYGYSYRDGKYDHSSLGDNCPWAISSFTDGNCSNWGNPLSEMYLEAVRYFKGESSATGAFSVDDPDRLPGLTTATWDARTVLASDNRCAPLNIISFNGSVTSYDGDGLGSFDETAVSQTDVIGDEESITDDEFFVGENGDNNNQLCTAKTVSALGSVEGLCPEAPRLDGTYKIAGLAYDAHVNDLRSDLAGIQTVNTFGIALAPAVPVITVPDPVTKEVKARILPACRDKQPNPDGNCALVDFKIVRQDISEGTGKFYVNWEDSEQGGDFDQDMWGTIEYALSGDQLAITTDVHAESTPYEMGFGYVVSGTTQDGFHVHSGIEGYDYDDPASGIPDCTNCQHTDSATTATYTLGTSTAGLLETPLFYAAKWGGFNDRNNNDKPDQREEWDRKTTEGLASATGDGIPDQYFFVTDPAALEKALIRVFEAILERTASGTAAAVVANTASGNGAAFQAMYEPLRKDTANREVKWIGALHALWLDETGLLREDFGTKGILEDYSTDPVVDIFYDETAKVTRIRRWTSTNDEKFSKGIGNELSLSELSPIWKAHEQLSSTNLASGIASNRASYTDKADTGRWIISWFDDGGGNTSDGYNGIVDPNEQRAFTADQVISDQLWGWFNAAEFNPDTSDPSDDEDKEAVENIVNYIRGKEISGLRNRTLDYDDDGSDEVLRLGDIIHSTPTPVASPKEAFNLLYSDKSYSVFRDHYENRRQVVYVGANDGMLHAFNGGFFGTTEVDTDGDGTGDSKVPTFKTKLTSEVEHPLGSELWAYVPMNLLPHLQYLTDPQYSHVYYMDLKARVFDAKIFTDTGTSTGSCPGGVEGVDGDHPCGWGTVLVAGMRLGGGEIQTDTGMDGLGSGNTKPADKPDATDDVTVRSSYVMLDITNPESAPKVLAEINHPLLQQSMSYPAVVAVRNSNSTKSDGAAKWYLIFGSGPTDISTATSDQKAYMLVYDLEKLAKGQSDGLVTGAPIDLGAVGAFTGDPIVVDWDLDYSADEIYIGAASGDATTPEGKMIRISIPDPDTDSQDPTDIGNWVKADLIDPSGENQAFLAPATAGIDEVGNHWLFASTGRYFVNADKQSTSKQTLYGVIDEGYDFSTSSSSVPNISGLIDTTNAHVSVEGDVDGVSGVSTLSELVAEVATAGGWERHLDYDTSQTPTEPSERGVFGSALLGGILFTPAFTPNEDLCGAEGTSQLYGLFFKTGTANQVPVFGTQPCGSCNFSSIDESVVSVSLGAGLASTPSIHLNPGSGKKVTVIEQISTAATKLEKATTEGRVQSGELSWRELME